MKLKHRKLILIISMSAMGIGLITFSIAGNKKDKTDEVSGLQVSEAVISEEVTPDPTLEATETPSPTDELTVTETPTPTDEPTEEPTEEAMETPTPTEEAVELEVDAYPEIDDLIKSFLQAKLDGKTKKLKKLVTDSSYINVEKMQKKTEFIESYDNIKVYTLKGSGDIDFIAYVYMEVKIASIDTKAPGLNEFYIKSVDGEYKIVQGEISDETAAYIDECRNTEAVQELLKKVNKKLAKATEEDEALAIFCEQLDATPTPEE